MFVCVVGEEEYRTFSFTPQQLQRAKKRLMWTHTLKLVEDIGRALDAPLKPVEQQTLRSLICAYAQRSRGWKALDGRINSIGFLVIRCRDRTYYSRHLGSYPAQDVEEAFTRAVVSFAHALPLFEPDEGEFCEASVYWNLKASVRNG